MRKFPIMARDKNDRPIAAFISWEVAELLRPQAMINHGQTLERLAERGGLCWIEAACCLAKCGWGQIKPTPEQAQFMLAGASHALARFKEVK